MTDEEMIQIHAKCGGGPVTKESILAAHQKMGGSPLSWEDLKRQHEKFGPLPVEIQNVKMEGTLEGGLKGVIEEIKDILEKEEWRYIPGYEGYYQVSNHGRVRSLDRYVSHSKGGQRLVKGKILKPQKIGKGYLRIGLYKNQKIKIRYKHYLIHVLVLTVFDRPPKEGEQCNHKDGNKENNHRLNLEWCTCKENIRHKINILGKTQVCNYKLTDQNVREIRVFLKEGKLTQKEIAKRYNVTHQTISCIKLDKNWKNLK
jgi:hypothetical protein